MKHSDKAEHGQHRMTRGRLLIDLEARTYTVLGATNEEAEALGFAGAAALRAALNTFELHRDSDASDREIVRRRWSPR